MALYRDPNLRWPVVLFDFDGTLADTIDLIVKSYHATLAGAGLPAVADAVVRTWIGRPLQDCFEATYPGRGAELTRAYRDWNLTHHDALIRAVDGIEDVLDALADAGARTGVVSSKRGPTVHLGLTAVGLAGRIEVLAGMEDTTVHKPRPEPLLFASGRIEAAPADCVYVGDAVVDVLAAHAAGMAAVAVTWGAGEPDALAAAGAEVIVDQPGELIDVLFSRD